MKLTHWMSLVLLPAALSAQESTMSASSPAWNGMEVHFLTKAEPPGPGVTRFPGGVIPKQDRTHRYITDREHRLYFGYDLVLEPLADPDTVRLRIEPLSAPRGQGGIEPGWTLVGPPKYPVIPVVRAGETVAFDLLVNAATGQKVVEYLTVRRGGIDSAQATKTPRDFSADDVEMTLERSRFFVNGKPVESKTPNGGGIVAHVLWFYLEGAGQFVISLRPVPGLGFQKAGTVAGNTLTFRDGSSEYRIECGTPIVPGSGLYNIYVSRDATCCTFPPGGDPLAIGGADKAEYLIHKR